MLYCMQSTERSVQIRAGKYYRSELRTDQDSATGSRTSYQWGFAKQLDSLEMGTMRDRIQRDTNSAATTTSSRVCVATAHQQPHIWFSVSLCLCVSLRLLLMRCLFLLVSNHTHHRQTLSQTPPIGPVAR
jgi:hypothetical protein